MERQMYFQTKSFYDFVSSHMLSGDKKLDHGDTISRIAIIPSSKTEGEYRLSVSVKNDKCIKSFKLVCSDPAIKSEKVNLI